VPAPSIEPAVIWLLLPGPEVPEKSTVPPALAMNRALPPVLLLVNTTPPLVVIVALPAVLVSEKATKKPALLTMVEVPAELEPRNDMLPLLVIAAFPAVPLLKKMKLKVLVKLGANAELLTIPAPLMSKTVKLTAKEYAVVAAASN
jgi:hypothetical protein